MRLLKKLIFFIFTFSLFSNRIYAQVNWESSTPLPKRIAPFHSLAYDKDRGNIYLIGGRVDDFSENPSKEVFKGKINEDLSITWIQQEDYPFKMKNSAAVYLKGFVYNIGGQDDQTKKVFKSDVTNGEINSWQEIVSLPNKSWRGQALVYKNRIYYLDGIEGKIWRLNDDETGWDNFGTLPKVGFGDFAASFFISPRQDVDYLFLTGGQTYSPRCHYKEIYKADVRTSDGKVLGFAQSGSFPDKYYPDPFNNDQDLDHGIKAYHQIVIEGENIYVFPAASFSTQDICPTGKTNTGSTIRSFVGDITYDGRVINWQVWGPGTEGISNIKVNGEYVNHWTGGFDGLNWVRDGLATNVYGGIKHDNYFFIIGGENYAGHTNQVAYIPLESVECQICSSGVAKDKGNADCNSVIDLIDFAWWLKVFKAGNNNGEVDFNCQESDTQHIVDLADFNVWLDNFISSF